MMKILNLNPHYIGGGIATYIRLINQALDELGIAHETWDAFGFNTHHLSHRMTKSQLQKLKKQIEEFNPSHIFIHHRIDPRIFEFFPKKTFFFLHETGMKCLESHIRLGKPCYKKFSLSCIAHATLTGCGPRRTDKNLPKYLLHQKISNTLKKNNIPLVSVSQFLIDFHRQQDLNLNPYYLLYPYFKAFSNDLIKPASKKYILYLGGYDEKKGIYFLLNALKLRKSNLTVRLCGPIGKKDSIVKLINEWGLSIQVEIKDYLNEAMLHQYYQVAEFVVMPSMIHEAFGIVGLESMAHQLPVIASRSGGISEWLTENETGFLVTPGQAQELATRIDTLASNPALCKAMGTRGHQLLQEKFSKDRFVQQLQFILKGVSQPH